MTKTQFSQLVLLNIGIQNQDAREAFDERVIWRLGDIVRGKLIYEYLKVSQSSGEFVKGMVLPVLKDTIRDRPYIQIGGVVLNMPNNAGLVSISLTQGDSEPITITSAGQIGIYDNLEAGQIGITAWQEGERIYFNQLGFEVENILVIGIPTIASLDDKTDIPIPYGVENDWLELVKQKCLPQIAEDKANDTRQSPV